MSDNNRSAQLERIAFELGMHYQPKDDWGLLNLLEDFHLFRRGGRKRIEHLMHQRDGMLESDIHIFDYRYTISTGKSSHTYKQTVFFMHSKKLGLPQFLMKPEHFFNKVGEWLNLSKDIDFEEYPKFSDQYWLKSDNEDYLRASVKDDFLKFFSIERDWHLEGINYYLVFYKKSKLLTPPQIKDFYKKGMKICEMLYHSDIA